MKIISSTSSTSISGVTLMSDFEPAPPVLNAITNSPDLQKNICARGLLGARRGRAMRVFLLDQFGDQADRIYARGAEIVHTILDGFVLGAIIGRNVHRLIHFVGLQVAHL